VKTVELFSAVSNSVASSTHRYQVLFGIIARVAAKLSVVDFEVRHCAARLTSPGIATQNLLP
jgi:hypothetical protein